MKEADLVIAIGPRLGEMTTSGYSLLDSPVSIATRGGELVISWAGTPAAALNSGHGNSARPASVQMTGPAVTVFEGEIELDG